MKALKDIDPDTKSNLIKGGCITLAVGVAGYGIYIIYRKVSSNELLKNKQAEIAKKKSDLYKKLEDLKTPFNSMEHITNLSLQTLIDGVESGTYKPVDILRAYQAKALTMDKEFNFITDLNPNAEADAIASVSGSKKGVLKGIPISIKDMFQVKDCECTYGMLSFCFKPCIQDSSIIRSLRMQGAVPFVITNMCQTGKSIESSNPIFGQTLNPHNKNKTSGGSSGGEGAILGAGASIIGLGSDIGGSIRIPSSYCGVFGLKPTANRFSRRYTVSLFSNQNLITFSVGPMARKFDDLLVFFKAMACGDLYHLDPYSPPLCFNEKIFLKKRPLKIGYYIHLGEGQVTPVPAVVRAVNMAKVALEASGHTLLPFEIPDVNEAIYEIYLKCLFTDGGYGFLEAIKNDPVDSSLSFLINILKVPNLLKKAISYAIYPFDKDYSNALYAFVSVPSVYELWKLKDKLEAYREKVLSKWQNEKLDGIICPVLPVTALPCQTSQNVTNIISYTGLYNLLDYPAGSVPVTQVNEKDIENLLASYPKDTRIHRRILDLQKDSLGMPVGVQCVCLPWREEICLRIMKDIDEHL